MDVAIIGAGLAGLGAAWKLHGKGINVTIFEKESRPGGLCRTENDHDFLFDYTGHLLHFNDPIFKNIVFSNYSGNLLEKNRNAWIWSKGVFTKYPFQANLFGLPVEDIVECLYDYSKQHFSEKKTNFKNYEEWILANYGGGIANHFMIPYNKKVYRRHPRELHPDCNGRFVPQSDLKLLLRGALSSNSSEIGYNASFFYPEINGIESLVKDLAKNCTILLNKKITVIDLLNSLIYTDCGESFHYDYILSTQPLTELLHSIQGGLSSIAESVNRLKYVSILNINFGIKGDISDKHWVYVPEEEYTFHRVGFAHNFSKNNVPDGCSSIYLEISYDPLIGINKNEAINKSIKDCMKAGLLNNPDDIRIVNVLNIPYGYVVFDHNRQNIVDKSISALESVRIFTAGRFGSWVYSSMEDAFMDGYRKAEKILNNTCKVNIN